MHTFRSEILRDSELNVRRDDDEASPTVFGYVSPEHVHQIPTNNLRVVHSRPTGCLSFNESILNIRIPLEGCRISI